MKPIVCYVTDRKALGAADAAGNVLAKIRAATAAGVDWVQIRERDMPARELLALVKAAIGAREGGARILVNDRLDVALAAGAAGVHLGGGRAGAGSGALAPRTEARRLNFWSGFPAIAWRKRARRRDAGASYVFFGPVFETPSKKSYGPPQGIAKLAEVCSAVAHSSDCDWRRE